MLYAKNNIYIFLKRPPPIYFEKHTRKCAGLIKAMLLFGVVRTVWGYRWLDSCVDAVVFLFKTPKPKPSNASVESELSHRPNRSLVFGRAQAG